MRCSHFESAFLPGNLAIDGNLMLELKAKQEGRTQLLLYLKLRARIMAKNIHFNLKILSIKWVVCVYCRYQN